MLVKMSKLLMATWSSLECRDVQRCVEFRAPRLPTAKFLTLHFRVQPPDGLQTLGCGVGPRLGLALLKWLPWRPSLVTLEFFEFGVAQIASLQGAQRCSTCSHQDHPCQSVSAVSGIWYGELCKQRSAAVGRHLPMGFEETRRICGGWLRSARHHYWNHAGLSMPHQDSYKLQA